MIRLQTTTGYLTIIKKKKKDQFRTYNKSYPTFSKSYKRICLQKPVISFNFNREQWLRKLVDKFKWLFQLFHYSLKTKEWVIWSKETQLLCLLLYLKRSQLNKSSNKKTQAFIKTTSIYHNFGTKSVTSTSPILNWL